MIAAGAVLAALVAALPQADHVPTMPGAIEGRPADRSLSPVQARIDAAAPGSRVEIGPGEYRGDLIIDRPMVLAGIGRPRLIGSGTGSVVRIRAPRVTVEGFDIDDRGGGE